jgi:hypothetical protein
MSYKRILLALFAYLILRFVFDAVLMPGFLREMAGSSYAPLRKAHLAQYHILAMLAHATLFVWLYALVSRQCDGSWRLGLAFGILAALLVSLPSALHVYAMVDKPASNVIYPVLWTVVTNAVGGIVVAAIVDTGVSRTASIAIGQASI